MRLLRFLFAISLLVFSIRNVVHAAPPVASRTEDLALLTNAQRFARGLGPKTPDHLRRRGDSPTLSRNQHHPSPIPPTPQPAKRLHHGHIQVWDNKTNTPLGYISKNTVLSGYKWTSKPGDQLQVSFNLDEGAVLGTGLEFNLENSDARGYGLLGLVVPSGVQNLGSFSQAWISSVKSSPAKSPASYPGNAHGLWTPSESAVWNADLLSHHLTPLWTQKDYTQTPLSLVAAALDGTLLAINLPTANAPSGYTLISLTFEEI